MTLELSYTYVCHLTVFGYNLLYLYLCYTYFKNNSPAWICVIHTSALLKSTHGAH